MKINGLIDDCLFEILNRIPLDDLYRAKYVNPKWKQVQKLVCRSKRNLKIIHMGYIEKFNSRCISHKFEKFLDLVILNESYYSELNVSNHFPNITHLKHLAVNFEKIDSFLCLLPKWKNLNCLKITIDSSESTEYQWNCLLQKLTSMHTLRSLTLNGFNTRTENKKMHKDKSIIIYTSQCALANLSQLEHLSINLQLTNYSKASAFVNSWPNLKRFNMYHFGEMEIQANDTKETYVPLFDLAPSTKLTHFWLTRNDVPFEFTQFSTENNFLSDNFPNLTHLNLCTFLPLQKLLSRYNLHRLNQLICLEVNNCEGFSLLKHMLMCPHQPPYPNYLPDPQIPTQKLDEIVQFNSLKTLKLQWIPHDDWSANINFQNLQVVKLSKEICCVCSLCCPYDLDFENNQIVYANYNHDCEQRFIESLSTITSLKEVIYDDKTYYIGPNESLLAKWSADDNLRVQTEFKIWPNA